MSTASERRRYHRPGRQSGMPLAGLSEPISSICRLHPRRFCARCSSRNITNQSSCKKEINSMTMQNIKFIQPRLVEDAMSLLAAAPNETKIISGGTALVIMLRNRLIAPSNLLSLRHLQELRTSRHEPGTGLRIGGLVTIREAEMSPLVRNKNLTLAQTFGRVGSVRVRNAATVGGNLRGADCG